MMMYLDQKTLSDAAYVVSRMVQPAAMSPEWLKLYAQVGPGAGQVLGQFHGFAWASVGCVFMCSTISYAATHNTGHQLMSLLVADALCAAVGVGDTSALFRCSPSSAYEWSQGRLGKRQASVQWS
jgi:hypothetical protein